MSNDEKPKRRRKTSTSKLREALEKLPPPIPDAPASDEAARLLDEARAEHESEE